MTEIRIVSGTHYDAAKLFARSRRLLSEIDTFRQDDDFAAYVAKRFVAIGGGDVLSDGPLAVCGGPKAEGYAEASPQRLRQHSLVDFLLLANPGSKRRTIERILVILRYGDKEIHRELASGRCSIAAAERSCRNLREFSRNASGKPELERVSLGQALFNFRNSLLKKPGGFSYWDRDKDFVFDSLVDWLVASGHVPGEEAQAIRTLVGNRWYPK